MRYTLIFHDRISGIVRNDASPSQLLTLTDMRVRIQTAASIPAVIGQKVKVSFELEPLPERTDVFPLDGTLTSLPASDD